MSEVYKFNLFKYTRVWARLPLSRQTARGVTRRNHLDQRTRESGFGGTRQELRTAAPDHQ
jgi:hypothetical protein